MDVYQRRRLVALSAVAALFVVFVLLIRSCGGDDEESPPTTPAVGTTDAGSATAQSQASFIDQGDTVCLEANTLIADIDESDPLAAAAEEANAVETEVQGLQTLLPPDEGQDELGKFLDALQDHYELLQDRVTAIENEDPEAQAELETLIAESDSKVAKRANRFGFENCGDPEAVGESTSGEGRGEGEEEADTGGTEGTVPPVTTTPVTPTTTPVTPPADTGTDGGVGTEPPADTGGTDGTGSGGVSP